MTRAFVPAKLRAALLDEIPLAWTAFLAMAGKETPYSFALYHDDDWGYVLATGNTIEGLERTARQYRIKSPEKYGGEQGLGLLRWSFCDSPFHCTLPKLPRSQAALLANAPSGTRHTAYTRAARAACIGALKSLDKRRLFGAHRTRLALNVVLGDMSSEVFDSGLKALNSRSTYDKHSFAAAAKRRLAGLKGLSPAARAEVFMASMREAADRDLDWELPTSNGISRSDARGHLAKLGAAAVDAIVGEIERVLANTSPEDVAYVVFDLPPLKRLVKDTHIRRLQAAVQTARVRDVGRRKNYTLPENIARTLHTLRPRRFPETDMDWTTNTLRNAEAYVP